MKKFLYFIFLIVIAISVSAFVLEKIYTAVYNSCIPRNKLQYIIKVKNINYDIVFLGSSRVLNHVDSRLFDSISHKKTINLGLVRAGLKDNLLYLELICKNNNISKVFLQIDNNYEDTSSSSIAMSDAMPFIDNPLINEFVKTYNPENACYAYIPFYRYAVNNQRIGLRELTLSILNNKVAMDLRYGFRPVFGHHPVKKITVDNIPSRIRDNNPVLDRISEFCKKRNIKLILFMSPIMYNKELKNYFGQLKKKLPGLIDLSHGYKDSLFFNNNHLNYEGAEIFTKELYYKTVNL